MMMIVGLEVSMLICCDRQQGKGMEASVFEGQKRD